ncbi:MAG: hypothetical protein WAS07_07580 [Micropruina sp.]
MDPEDLRLAIHRAFASTGRAPEATDLGATLGVTTAEVADGLAERGYTRQEPSAAADNLRSVGLSGRFGACDSHHLGARSQSTAGWPLRRSPLGSSGTRPE